MEPNNVSGTTLELNSQLGEPTASNEAATRFVEGTAITPEAATPGPGPDHT
jgi:hypothetical protein